jgi:DNA-binding transcriptional regulator YiaG
MLPQSIIQALKTLGISRYRISCDTGISEQCLGHWVNGKRRPNMDSKKVCKMVKKLTEYYNQKMADNANKFN